MNWEAQRSQVQPSNVQPVSVVHSAAPDHARFPEEMRASESCLVAMACSIRPNAERSAMHTALLSSIQKVVNSMPLPPNKTHSVACPHQQTPLQRNKAPANQPKSDVQACLTLSGTTTHSVAHVSTRHLTHVTPRHCRGSKTAPRKHSCPSALESTTNSSLLMLWQAVLARQLNPCSPPDKKTPSPKHLAPQYTTSRFTHAKHHAVLSTHVAHQPDKLSKGPMQVPTDIPYMQQTAPL